MVQFLPVAIRAGSRRRLEWNLGKPAGLTSSPKVNPGQTVDPKANWLRKSVPNASIRHGQFGGHPRPQGQALDPTFLPR